MMHEMFRLRLHGKLHLAPIENPHWILDVGTGTGLFAIEMGSLEPYLLSICSAC